MPATGTSRRSIQAGFWCQAKLPAKMAGEFATLFPRLANSPDAVTDNVKGIYGAKTASSPLRHGVRGPGAWSRREHPPTVGPWENRLRGQRKGAEGEQI